MGVLNTIREEIFFDMSPPEFIIILIIFILIIAGWMKGNKK